MNSDTTEVTPPAEPVWGSGPAEPAHWSKNRILAAAGIAAVLAGAGAAVIYAAGGGSDSPGGPGGGHGGGPGWGPPPGGFGGPGGAGPMGNGPAVAGMGDALHGEFVVPDGHGGYRTQLTQTGTVTDISDTSVTARSADGYTQTYVITTDTHRGKDPVRNGDTATIRAIEDNGANTATVIAPSR